MNSILGDSHHHQELNWVNRIRCAKHKTSGRSEAILGHWVTLACAGDPTETTGGYKPGA